MGRTPRRHLLLGKRVACGRRTASTTTDPARVTCRDCTTSLHMADAIASAAVKQRRKR